MGVNFLVKINKNFITLIALITPCWRIAESNQHCSFIEKTYNCIGDIDPFRDESQIEELIISDSNIHTIKAQIKKYSSLSKLSFLNCTLKSDQQENFYLYFPALHTLNISNSHVSETVLADFVRAANLRFLTLQRCYLNSLQKKTFMAELDKLKTIDLRNNEISVVENVIQNLTTITTIDLSYNQIGKDFHAAVLTSTEKCVFCIPGRPAEWSCPRDKPPCRDFPNFDTLDILFNVSTGGVQVLLKGNPVCDRLDDAGLHLIRVGVEGCQPNEFTPWCPNHAERAKFLFQACQSDLERSREIRDVFYPDSTGLENTAPIKWDTTPVTIPPTTTVNIAELESIVASLRLRLKEREAAEAMEASSMARVNPSSSVSALSAIVPDEDASMAIALASAAGLGALIAVSVGVAFVRYIKRRTDRAPGSLLSRSTLKLHREELRMSKECWFKEGSTRQEETGSSKDLTKTPTEP